MEIGGKERKFEKKKCKTENFSFRQTTARYANRKTSQNDETPRSQVAL
jgi:hypothetical protein